MFVGKIYYFPKDFLFYKPFTLKRQNKRNLNEIYYKNLILVNNLYTNILSNSRPSSEESSCSWEMLERKKL